MKHLLSTLTAAERPAIFAATTVRLPRSSALPLAPVVLAALLGCPFQVGSDDSDDDYQQEPTSSAPRPSTSAAQGSSNANSAYGAAASSNSSSRTGSGNATQSNVNAANAGNAGSTNASGATCGSDCASQDYVTPYITRCAGSPSQGPCYCAAALTYYCFYDKGCYQENGYATSVTKDQLSQGLLNEVQNSEDLGYDCRLQGNGVDISLNEALAPYLDRSSEDSDFGTDDGADFASEEEAADAEDEQMPAGGRCPAGRVCALPAR